MRSGTELSLCLRICPTYLCLNDNDLLVVIKNMSVITKFKKMNI